jgi:ribosomal protein L15
LVIKANKFSVAAKAKIEAAGGEVEEIGYATKAS